MSQERNRKSVSSNDIKFITPVSANAVGASSSIQVRCEAKASRQFCVARLDPSNGAWGVDRSRCHALECTVSEIPAKITSRARWHACAAYLSIHLDVVSVPLLSHVSNTLALFQVQRRALAHGNLRFRRCCR